MNELVGARPDSAECKESLDSRRLQVYHVTKTRYLPTILQDGLVPGTNYDADFNGIVDDVIDRFAPGNLREKGVLRRNVVYAYFSEDALIKTRNDTTLRLNVNRSRVYVGDDMPPFGQIWNLCLLEPCRKAEDLLRRSNWTKLQSRMLDKLFLVHFLDDDFLHQIVSRYVQDQSEKIELQLREIIKEGHDNIRTVGKREVERYWRSVVPYDQFQNGSIRINYDPEALIVGRVAPEDIRFLSRGK